VENTPFAYILHYPMQIYLGKYDTNQTILVFLGGLAWCLALFILAKIVFKLGLKRNESVGL
jgi:ABC-2 type transport system permease protein